MNAGWKTILPLAALLAAGLAFWLFRGRQEGPEVAFTKVTRHTLSNTLSTNGKVEPVESVEVHVESPGVVRRVAVHAGDTVQPGQVLAELSQPGTGEELASAEARAAQARAELQTLREGGRTSELAEIDGSVNRLKGQREAADHNLESLDRLQKMNAATPYEVEQARQALAELDVQLQSLGLRRVALVGRGDLRAAQARLQEAEANVALSKTHVAQNTVRTPIGGVVYDLPARAGAYLNAGDAVASVGRIEPVRVRVYVDEPELGRVDPGEAVRITWDALAGREWTGTVEKRPSEVVALGSRQVGEVLCTVQNPRHELIPGTNVNAFILTQVVRDALSIPRAAVRRENGIGVWVLGKDDTTEWRPVKTGVSDTLRVEVLSGLREGEMVAQPSDQPLRQGGKVRALLQ